jgi:hypothetical protein
VTGQLMTPAELAALLRSLADSVESGDSLEGSLQYLIPEGDERGLRVTASLRTGNRDGQGGYVLIGENT